MWAQTYEQLTSISNIDESADYVLGISGTGFHYEGTSSWGKIALPSSKTPLFYRLVKANDGNSFKAYTSISNTTYYLQIPSSENTFSMTTSSSGTNTDIIIGTTKVTGTNYAVANKSTTDRHLRINGTSGLRSYASTTGTMAFFYKVIPAFTLTAESNNTSWGTVAVSGNKITASPAIGYRISTTTPYTVTSGTATVVQNNNEFTVTASAACTVRINFEEGPKYTVTYTVGAGTCGTASATEATYQGGVVLPTATCTYSGWSFAGWAEASTASTSTRPTLYAAGSTYHPTANIPLYAVYSVEGIGGAQYKRAASVDEVTSASSVAIVTNKDGYILNYALTNGLAAPSEVEGKITMSDNYAFTLSGNNTEGFTISSTGNKNVGPNGAPTSGSKVLYIDTDITTKWIVEKYNNNDNIFVLRIAGSDGASMQYYSSDWVAYYTKNYSTDADGAMKIYVPEVIYNSNPTSAIIQPSVAFTSSDKKILYLDGVKTYTNTASVTGVEKSVSAYTSSNTSVATVNASGVVTAVGIGTATITAKLNPELGVHSAASAEYIVEVKNTTTIAGIKALASTQTQVQFSADLTDAVVTYVQGNYAYIQDASAAINVNYANHGLVAGQKINGAVSGYVKAPNQIDQIAEIDRSKATVTNDGIIPAAEVKTLAEIKAAGTDYDGKLVTVNAVFISKPSTTTTLTDGSKIGDEEVSFTLYSPNSAVSVNNQEKGNFTGFVSIYNGNTYRLNLYEQGQFVKTHNVPQNQDMSFATAAYNLDEETDDVTSFAGQAVTETTVKGGLTYSIKEGSDDIITSLNAVTGAVVLNGSCGTATIVATAAAYDEYDEGTGYYTPYKELSKEYNITVRPRYSVTFSINGNTDEVRRQDSYGAAITAPEVAAIGDYEFQGWSDTEVSKTNTKPTMTTGTSITPTTNKTVYAVYAIKTQTGTTDVEDQSYSYSAGNLTVGGTYTDKSSDSYYLLHNGGYVESAEFDLSIITKVVVYGGTFGGTTYNSLTIGDGTNIWKEVTVTGKSQTGSNTFTGGTALSGTGKLRITSTCGSNSGDGTGVRVSGFKIYKLGPVYGYTNYTTAFNVGVTIPASGYLSYCSPYKLDFSDTNVKAYTASVDNTGTVTLTKVDVVPAEEGVVLFSSEAQTANEAKDYTVPVTAEDASDVTGNQMVGVLARTQVEWNPSDGVYNYILQQGEFRKATTPGGYLKANRAYLSTSYDVTAAGARPLTIVFEGETTRISNVNANDNFDDNAPMYNLAGQKVGKSYKGIVIQNGKKILKK